MDLATKTTSELIELLNATALKAKEAYLKSKTIYRLKQDLQYELNRRIIPESAVLVDDALMQSPKGLTSKQISQIRAWSKARHSPDDLIKFINQIVSES